MNKNFPGGFITSYDVTPADGLDLTSSSPIPGRWTLKEVNQYQAQYKWIGAVPPWVSGQVEYTTAGTYTFVAESPLVSVVCVGGGGGGYSTPDVGSNGGGGGGLGYKNNYPVTRGASYTVVVGAAGPANVSTPSGDSYFVSPAVVRGGGGAQGLAPSPRAGGTYTGDGGGNGGLGATGGSITAGGGGGAGGYSGNGGAAGTGASNGSAGSGGGGGGGGGGGPIDRGGGGGGVGLLGEGSSGAGGIGPGGDGTRGDGGSGGVGGGGAISAGGAYGGGGAGADNTGEAGLGGVGAVRIIWGADGVPRAFPTTNTGNL